MKWPGVIIGKARGEVYKEGPDDTVSNLECGLEQGIKK
jgi:hypothetical protein